MKVMYPYPPPRPTEGEEQEGKTPAMVVWPYEICDRRQPPEDLAVHGGGGVFGIRSVGVLRDNVLFHG